MDKNGQPIVLKKESREDVKKFGGLAMGNVTPGSATVCDELTELGKLEIRCKKSRNSERYNHLATRNTNRNMFYEPHLYGIEILAQSSFSHVETSL